MTAGTTHKAFNEQLKQFMGLQG